VPNRRNAQGGLSQQADDVMGTAALLRATLVQLLASNSTKAREYPDW
jgi:hypothetical protein